MVLIWIFFLGAREDSPHCKKDKFDLPLEDERSGPFFVNRNQLEFVPGQRLARRERAAKRMFTRGSKMMRSQSSASTRKGIETSLLKASVHLQRP